MTAVATLPSLSAAVNVISCQTPVQTFEYSVALTVCPVPSRGLKGFLWMSWRSVVQTKEVPLRVTYHDPCHLGRRSKPYVPGEPIDGIYEPPRDILKAIPGLELVEMERIKEYAWCCGAGGGVKEAYPDFALWTAGERMEEAKAAGAEAIVTACPWCERNYIDAINERGEAIKVYDIVELVQQAI